MTVLDADTDSSLPPGSATVFTMFVPCRPLGVPPVEAPRSRFSTPAIDVEVIRSVFATKCDSGTWTPLMPSFCRSSLVGARKRSSQMTSLASSRSACETSRSASLAAVDAAVALNVSASPCVPLTRSCSASTTCWFSSRSRPGGFSAAAFVAFWRSCSAMLDSFE